MSKKSSQNSDSPVYGFGEFGIMSKEYFPYFMFFYILIFLIAVIILLWKLKGYNKREKQFRDILKSKDLKDEAATFVPSRSSHKLKQEKIRTDSNEREGRTMMRKATIKLLEKRAKQARKRAGMVLDSSTGSEDSEFAEEERLYIDRNGRIKEE